MMPCYCSPKSSVFCSVSHPFCLQDHLGTEGITYEISVEVYLMQVIHGLFRSALEAMNELCPRGGHLYPE